MHLFHTVFWLASHMYFHINCLFVSCFFFCFQTSVERLISDYPSYSKNASPSLNSFRITKLDSFTSIFWVLNIIHINIIQPGIFLEFSFNPSSNFHQAYHCQHTICTLVSLFFSRIITIIINNNNNNSNNNNNCYYYNNKSVVRLVSYQPISFSKMQLIRLISYQ